ncbi:RING-type E3 ubiquitin transferase [Sarracenia purpurea var. burkii]
MEVEQDPVSFFMSLDRWPQSSTHDDDDENENEPFASQPSETFMVGFVIVNIVGLQYYSGTISGREMVGLVREPLNPYDENAIKVLNTRTVQVGHVERSASRVLAPLIDQNLISVEGIVPNTAGRGNRYKIPVQVHIFAHWEAFSRVKSDISRGGLQLIANNDASFTLSDAVVVKEMKSDKDGRSTDDIFTLVDENVRKKSAMEAVEPPRDVIKSELFVHQKEGLGWLIHRENSCELPPFWEERNGAYVNVLTNYLTHTRPEPLRGGIFADDMGLGKTLTLLSLIAFDKCSFSLSSIDSGRVKIEPSGGIDEEDDRVVISGFRKAKRGRPSKTDGNSRKKRKTEVTHLDKTGKGKSVGGCAGGSGLKSTLIVCPPSVFSTWVTQLGEHTRPGRLKVYMYYGERTQDANELQKYDIILTTYSTLGSEVNWPDTPMKKIEWWRVILDEAHVIKNVNSQQSRAVAALNAKRRWVVTGTPIQNGSLDLFALMTFLRFEPFSIKSYWNSLVQRPLAQGNEKGLLRLQVLMATISLRRTKDKDLSWLPLKTIETCFVELSVEERELYDQMENEAKSVVRNYINAGSVTNNYSTVLSIILRLRQICTNLALCPSDMKSFLPSSNIEDVSNNPELLKKMVSLLQDGEDLDCPICISPPSDIVITCCAHIFCRSCILKTLKRTRPCCPLCRHPLSESDLFSSPPDSFDTDDSKVSSSNMSSKVSALLKLLSALRAENPNTKSVVFSQFRKMLMLLEEPLKAAGFKVLRLDGTMNAKRRARVIQEFEVPAPDGPTVLLASLKASGAGINLTAASRVYLLEPWWNPAVEEQAMDRVHRIGQTDDVKIVRMIARNSIEERILELQEKKKKLAREAFGRRGPKDRREVSVDDLRTLMSLFCNTLCLADAMPF